MRQRGILLVGIGFIGILLRPASLDNLRLTAQHVQSRIAIKPTFVLSSVGFCVYGM